MKEYTAFDFSRDVLPEEFRNLLGKERKVIDVNGPEPQKTKEVVEKHVGHMFSKAAAPAEPTASV